MYGPSLMRFQLKCALGFYFLYVKFFCLCNDFPIVYFFLCISQAALCICIIYTLILSEENKEMARQSFGWFCDEKIDVFEYEGFIRM